MQIKIGIPCLDMMHSRFVECLTNLKTPERTHLDFQIGTIVYVGRENVCANAIKDGSDYILWIDSDMIFKGDELLKLLDDAAQKKTDIVTGLCFMRRPPFKPCIWSNITLSNEAERKQANIFENYPKESLFEIDACGMAFCLVKTKIVKKVFERYGTCFSPLPGYGEDISFCIRAKNCGAKIMCDSSVKIGHIGQMVVTDDTFEKFKTSEASAFLNSQALKINMRNKL